MENDLFKYNKKELFDALIDILNRFIAICNEHNLKYAAFGGTLLGAVRHSGIIPWDDDIDIVMPRQDYDKLMKLIEKRYTFQGETKYQFLNTITDPYFAKGFTRLTNIKTTEIPIKDAMYKYNHGCFIDIFPLDDIPNNKFSQIVYFKSLKLYISLLYAAGRYKSAIGTLGLSSQKKIMYYLLSPLFCTNVLNTLKIYRRLNRCASMYSKKKSSYKEIGTTVFSAGAKRFIYAKEDYFGELIDHPFNTIIIKIPRGYDAILRKCYGEYMTPVKQPSEHGETIVDVNVGYEEFIRLHKDELQEIFSNVKTHYLK